MEPPHENSVSLCYTPPAGSSEQLGGRADEDETPGQEVSALGASTDQVLLSRPRDPFNPILFVKSETLTLCSGAEFLEKFTASKEAGGLFPRFSCKSCGSKLFQDAKKIGFCIVYFTPKEAPWLFNKKTSFGGAENFQNCVEVGRTFFPKDKVLCESHLLHSHASFHGTAHLGRISGSISDVSHV